VLIHEKFPDIDLVRITSIIHAKDGHIPIMLIVSDPEAANAVSAFNRNVSDCITANISPSALALHIQRCFTTLAPERLKIPLGRSLFLPEASQILCHNQEWIDLLPKENELLLQLCVKQCEISAKEDLIRVLWGQRNPEKYFPLSHWQMNLDSLMYSLKKKLKNLNDIHIETIKRIGYRLNIPAEV